MREIKFRAWNRETSQMVDLHEITPLALDPVMNDQLAMKGGSGLFIPFLDELALMQYIGLKDYNGKELYHNDILWESIDNLYGEIVWIESAWAVEIYEAGEKVDTFVGSDFEQFCKFNHLAGNIYQNPELLNSSV